MLRLTACFLLVLLSGAGYSARIVPGHSYRDIAIARNAPQHFSLHLQKGSTYDFQLQQQGMDVVLTLCNSHGDTLAQKDSPNGRTGPERFFYKAPATADFIFSVVPFADTTNPPAATYSLIIKKLSAAQLADHARIDAANARTVQTLDIDHFWEAYDALRGCHSHRDSLQAFEEYYLGRATDGLLAFISVRPFSAEAYVQAIAQYPKFYTTIRANTLKAKEAAPAIDTIFNHFRTLYPGFKPAKVCFAIGTVSTGGTVQGEYVLIGTEISTANAAADLSDFRGSAMGKVLASGDTDILQHIRNIVAHECVHTQQPEPAAGAVSCHRLYNCIHEGACDFIGELIAGGQINRTAQAYGNAHEAALWQEFEQGMCRDDNGPWLYNYSLIDRPADLGYFIGYKIAAAYYRSQPDKARAIADIIALKDARDLLRRSGYTGQSGAATPGK